LIALWNLGQRVFGLLHVGLAALGIGIDLDEEINIGWYISMIEKST